MFNNQKAKHQMEIKKHTKAAKKKFQYSLRLDDQHQKMLHQMAQGSTMASVIDNALEVKWNYHQVARNLVAKLAQLKDTAALEKWVVMTFQTNPELLNQYAKIGAIINHTKELASSRQVRQDYLNDLDTIAYLLNKFGTNCNQLAKCANMGGNVAAVEVRQLSIQIRKLNHTLELLRKQVQ